jgi:circadian clock protein KaiB
MSKFTLRLFITGHTPKSERAIANLRTLCDERPADSWDVTIIDVLEQPQLAEDERILATPTLIKSLPPPLRRIIGDLSNVENVVLGLDIRSTPVAGHA